MDDYGGPMHGGFMDTMTGMGPPFPGLGDFPPLQGGMDGDMRSSRPFQSGRSTGGKQICRLWQRGQCNYGDTCKYSHGEMSEREGPSKRGPPDLRDKGKMMGGDERPSFYKTALCVRFMKTGDCMFGANCKYAHGEEDLRPVGMGPGPPGPLQMDLGPLPPMGAPLLGSLGMMGVSMGPGPMGMGMPPPGLGLPSQGMMMMPNQGGGGMPNNGMGMSGPGPVHGMPRPPPGPPPGGPPGPKPFAGKQERDRQREMGPATSVTPKPEPDGIAVAKQADQELAKMDALERARAVCMVVGVAPENVSLTWEKPLVQAMFRANSSFDLWKTNPYCDSVEPYIKQGTPFFQHMVSLSNKEGRPQ